MIVSKTVISLKRSVRNVPGTERKKPAASPPEAAFDKSASSNLDFEALEVN
jgi:hypothetical protein